ncbi:diguanylate cyclase [Histidinibacterium aquaticum]|uniref:diguanylate cyclase n=1 Tax=Histidinibacterium aquaticum TaxID=2613962 RepID=A0A5J5GC21_9RHOB|nr:diguanylate cyclase [Histidinibacterium aquaticum]KAA9005705.1 diguanylate cyclase [Histidinibacterium aquaticum]
MSARIFILDGAVTNRIVLKVRLLAARYDVEVAASLSAAARSMAARRPDLVLVDCGAGDPEDLAILQDVRALPGAPGVPIVAMGGLDSPDARLAGFAAGADEVMTTPIHDVLLLARIRSLLRIRDTEAELALREETARALGFSEPPAGFEGPERISLVVPATAEGRRRAESVARALPGPVDILAPEDALATRSATDIYLIDATCLDDRTFRAEIFHLVADLRARSASRFAAQLVILPRGSEGMAGMVLDLGADDLVCHDVGLQELAHRVRTLLRRKRQQDALRATVASGLEAAVTDPLTGLHNRRYAESHLAHLCHRGREEKRSFAMMVLDIDHFKQINDRWGHAAGDAVLKAVADRLRINVRSVDLVARIGGEEFLVAMPDTSAAVAQHAAERLCHLIEEMRIAVPGTRMPVRVTMSIGVALGNCDGSPCEDIDALLCRADAALYAAKNSGRNTVSLSAA